MQIYKYSIWWQKKATKIDKNFLVLRETWGQNEEYFIVEKKLGKNKKKSPEKKTQKNAKFAKMENTKKHTFAPPVINRDYKYPANLGGS